MSEHFPYHFTLDSGTRVEVTKPGNNQYHFKLVREDGGDESFNHIEDERTKSDMEEGLSFDQMNALRHFWIQTFW